MVGPSGKPDANRQMLQRLGKVRSKMQRFGRSADPAHDYQMVDLADLTKRTAVQDDTLAAVAKDVSDAIAAAVVKRIKGPLTKRYPSNWELAGARASSVVRLFERAGIDGERLQAISRAEFAPVSSNNDAEGRGQNRRIEIRLRPRVNDAVKPEAIQEILSEPDAPVAEQVDDTATDPVAPKTD